MYLYRVVLVIKSALFISFIFIVLSSGFSQNPDSISLIKSSRAFLENKIDFSWEGGKLSEAFDQLSIQHNYQFAFSDGKIQNVYVEKNNFESTPVSDVLGTLLENSGFNYMVVGRNIIIVKNKTAPENTTIKDPSPEIDLNSHIYSGSALADKISPYEQKLLKNIYRKELHRQARKRKLERSGNIDSLSNSKPARASVHRFAINSFYIKGSLGGEPTFISYKDNSSLNWKRDLNFKTEYHKPFFGEIGAGIFFNYFIMETGLMFRTLNVTSTYKKDAATTQTGLRGAAKPVPPSPGIPVTSFTEKYSVVSIPANILVYKQHKSFYGALGTGISIHFLSRVSQKHNLKDYYENNAPDTYTEKNYKISYGISLKSMAGLKIRERTLIAGSVDYNFYLRPFFKNSLYKVYPHSFTIKLSLYYFLNKK